jgi:hypothetical protein
VLKYRVPHGSQPRPGWVPDPLMVGIRSPDGPLVAVAVCLPMTGLPSGPPSQETIGSPPPPRQGHRQRRRVLFSGSFADGHRLYAETGTGRDSGDLLRFTKE